MNNNKSDNFLEILNQLLVNHPALKILFLIFFIAVLVITVTAAMDGLISIAEKIYDIGFELGKKNK